MKVIYLDELEDVEAFADEYPTLAEALQVVEAESQLAMLDNWIPEGFDS